MGTLAPRMGLAWYYATVLYANMTRRLPGSTLLTVDVRVVELECALLVVLLELLLTTLLLLYEYCREAGPGCFSGVFWRN